MILTTHAIVGVATASFFPDHPVMAFVAGFASHFVLDAIPHWDYPIRSDFVSPQIGGKLRFDRALFLDVTTIGSDIASGFILSWFIFGSSTPLSIILIGALAGILPDPLQFLYSKIRREPLITLQRFHERVQRHSHIFKNNPTVGILSQIIFVIAIVSLARLAMH